MAVSTAVLSVGRDVAGDHAAASMSL